MAIKVTKFPQSCLVIEVGETRLLVDPGKYTLADFGPDDFGAIDAVLYTHRHADHFQPELLEPMVAQGARIVTNEDVAGIIDGYEVTVLADGASTDVNGVGIRAHDIPHCVMVDGSPGPPNTGFVVDDQLLHPGDGIEAPVRVDVVAVPIAGPSISMRDSYLMIDAAKAQHAIPIHYDGFIAKPEQLDQWCDIAEIHVLENGGTVTV